jgi:DNA end-binding protein Ku
MRRQEMPSKAPAVRNTPSARAMWKGSISFGLVMIPVRVSKATGSDEPSFHLIHRADGGAVRYVKKCAVCGDELQMDQLGRAVEAAGGLIPLTDDEEERLAPRDQPGRVAEVTQFFPADDVDPMLYQSWYYLDPQAGGEKAYALLLNAMESANLVALTRIKFNSRSPERLAVITIRSHMLVLATLMWPEEVRPRSDVQMPEVTRQEQQLASRLVGSMKRAFKPKEHTSERAQLARDIATAKSGQAVQNKPQTPRDAAADLNAALQASLDAMRSKK